MKKQIDLDWEGIINLLAKHLYSEKRIFVREIIQNAHDAIMKRRARDDEFSSSAGSIRVIADKETRTVSFIDDGIGMSEKDLSDFLATVGRGETRIARDDVPGVIGNFGIGFLSAFIVAKSVTVTTRKYNSISTFQWKNEGQRDYEIEEVEGESIGTKVEVLIDPSQSEMINETVIRDVIADYCDMLKTPIFVGSDETPTNSITMPWEKDRKDKKKQEAHIGLYLEERTPDNVLEVICLKEDYGVRGALYISRARTLLVEMPRHVQVYVRRMMVSKNSPDLLPEWANFVNGVIDSDTLEPTAARDNIQRDEEFERVRKLLGQQVLEHLKRLKREDRDRFENILRFHRLRILSACLMNKELFDEFSEDITWRANSLVGHASEASKDIGNAGNKGHEQFLTLNEIIEISKGLPGSSSNEVLAFSTGNQEHFFEMANASQQIVIDATDVYEIDLLQKLIGNHNDIKLILIDREDHSAIFKEPKGNEGSISNICSALATYVRPGDSRLDVSAKSFLPDKIPGILRVSEDDRDRIWATETINDPNASEQSKAVAKNILKQAPKSIRFTINSDNSIVQKISQLDFNDSTNRDFLLGIYNSSFLVSGVLTKSNARVLSNDFLKLLEMGVDASNTLAEQRNLISALKADAELTGDDDFSVSERRYASVFVACPYVSDFDIVETALRDVIEGKWGCRLILGRDEFLDERLLDSIRKHIDSSDAFLIDVSGNNPNVLFELGLVAAQRRNRPVGLLLSASDSQDELLPSDLHGFLYVKYDVYADQISAFFDEELRKSQMFQNLLDRPDRHRYLSAERISVLLDKRFSASELSTLVRNIPTIEKWQTVGSPEEIQDFLPDPDFASLVLKRVQREL